MLPSSCFSFQTPGCKRFSRVASESVRHEVRRIVLEIRLWTELSATEGLEAVHGEL